MTKRTILKSMGYYGMLAGLHTIAAAAVALSICASGYGSGRPGTGAFPSLIPIEGGHPEGVAVDKRGNVFVSVNVVTASGEAVQIWKYTPSGEKSVLADLGINGGACGLAVDGPGDVYMAQPLGAPSGVVRVGRDGGVTRLPGTEPIIGADALAFDQRGTLFVSEIFSLNADGTFGQGGIWRIPKGGTAELWLRHELLTGTGPTLFWYPVGANGIGFYHGALYVANSERGIIARIAVNPDGSPGEPEIWKQVEEVPEVVFPGPMFLPVMIDGLTLDVHGNVYVPVPTRCAVVRINASDRSQDTVAYWPEAPLDAPLSLSFGTGKGEKEHLFLTNSGLAGAFIPGIPWAGPGVVKVDAGMPGLPLP